VELCVRTKVEAGEVAGGGSGGGKSCGCNEKGGDCNLHDVFVCVVFVIVVLFIEFSERRARGLLKVPQTVKKRE
jgi:hypothetical protein